MSSRVQLLEETVRLGKGKFSKDGSLVVETGEHTGRAAKYRYLSEDAALTDVDWGSVNKAFSSENSQIFFHEIEKRVLEKKYYQMHGFVGCFPVEVFSTSPWHIAFAENMFRQSGIDEVLKQVGEIHPIKIFHDPYGKASDYGMDYKEKTLILLDLKNLRIGICGTAYAGEIKKSAFSACNYLLPQRGIFPMHASANCAPDGSNSSVLFGLSGTGKTTLSADPSRALIGDDEIIWTNTGLSNLEGGCYAKLIKLSQSAEPEIWSASNRFGSVLENVAFNEEARTVDFDSDEKTENTRSSYDISALSNVFDQSKEADEPKTIIFLTADAFGALPAVAKLDANQAQYHFMAGYTAKVAGTELGVKEPTAAFSACFGAPFMPQHPAVYAKMLAEKAATTGASVWLLNTGWIGGYQKGRRFPIQVSRQLLAMIQAGELAKQPMIKHPVFGFEVPTSCPEVDPQWLEIPKNDSVYALAEKFEENFKKFLNVTDPDVALKGGPQMKPIRLASDHKRPEATL